MLLSAAFWFFLCTVIACVEIESEGTHGWAEAMPTWRRTVCWSARPVTGYHLFMLLLPVLFLHAHFFMGVAWTLDAEFHALSMWCVVMALWDFLWFVLNPHYGIHDFHKEKVWWHAGVPWVFGLFPVDYLYAVVASIVLARLGGRVEAHVTLLFWLAGFTGAAVAVAPHYHDWYWKMRQPTAPKETEP